MQEICKKYDILLHIDEVVCGLDRTGKWFGYQHFDIQPDFVTMAKRVASGYAAVSCTVTTEHVFDIFKDDAADPMSYFRDISTFGMHVEFERKGKLNAAEKPWQVEGLKAQATNYCRFGIDCEPLEGEALKRRLRSPVYVAGLFEPNYATLNPGKMVAELRRVALSQFVSLHENTPVTKMRKGKGGIELVTPGGVVRAARVVRATNAAPPLLSRLRRATIPVFDYTLFTRPLSEAELQSIGWADRHSIADCGNQFDYSRKTADNRILWGGYDAVYHFGSRQYEADLREGGLTATTTKCATFSKVWSGSPTQMAGPAPSVRETPSSSLQVFAAPGKTSPQSGRSFSSQETSDRKGGPTFASSRD